MRNDRRSSPLFRLLSYAKSHRTQVWLGVLYSIINKIFDLAPPVLIGTAVDVVVSQEQSFLSRLGVQDVTLQLWLLAGITLLLWSFESLFDYLASVVWRNLAQNLQHELRLDAYQHLQSLELAYFEDRTTGELMAVLNDDVNQLERFLDGGAHEILITLTTVVVVGAIFLSLVPSIAWMALLPMPFVALGSLYFQGKVAPRYASVREQAGMVNSILANNIGGIATVKSFSAEQHELGRIASVSEEYRRRNRQAIRISSAFVPLIRMIIVVGFAAILVYAGKQTIAGELNVGVYSVLVFMTQRLLWPLTRLGATLDLYQRGMASTTRVLDVLAVKPEIVDGSDLLETSQVRGSIRFDEVTFAYRSRDAATIDALSLNIIAGQTVGIVGSTGSGKTTIVKLLLRFYDVCKGSILLDSVNIRSFRLNDLRNAIGLVSQDVFLVDGTVRENICYGSFSASDDEVVAAAKVAEVHEFILSLPDGYETLVGERGQKLSGGQRQRISIARAVLKNPPVLILDEATSSVDNETEAAIQRAMDRLGRERTMVIIAHRLSTVRNADIIFVLENGRLSESGTHEELLHRKGAYSKLWRVQTGEGRLVAPEVDCLAS